MKKKHLDHKLRLDRETLVPLQSAQLEGVAGGITPAVFVGGVAVGWALSRAFC
jgi:hypothetical protein